MLYSDFSNQQFVDWFRHVSPYIHAHRGLTFVICFNGEAINAPHFNHLMHDIALLHSLGIRLVIVHGIRPQIDHELSMRGLQPRYINNIRVTDEIALACVKAACGEVKTTIESCLSMGLTNHPTIANPIRTVSGNFITARPIGVRDGVDYLYTGEIRRIDALSIKQQLDSNHIVLISPLGYSPTGEAFNLLTADVASEIAIALQATKWVYLTENPGIFNRETQLVHNCVLTVSEAKVWLNYQGEATKKSQLARIMRACEQGVHRVHLVDRKIEGALLLELFSREGIGIMVSADPYENIREATINDVGGLLELIQPLEEQGVLVRRSREKLEMEISHFIVQERDGTIVACVALYPFPEEKMAELACLVVHPQYRREHRANTLLTFLEKKARQLGIEQIFVLTTQTAHWFQERGFKPVSLSDLPVSRQGLYNFQRNSKLFIKSIT